MKQHNGVKRRLAVLASLMLLAAACGGEEGGDTAEGLGSNGATEGDEAAANEGPIQVGAVLDITGPGASLAGPQVKALEMLAEQVNAEGGIDGRQIELEIIDNQSAEAEAAKATTRLANEEVDLIIGASRTGPSMAMRQIAIDEQVPMIALAAGDAIVQDAPWVFKTTKGVSTIVEKLALWYEAQGYGTVGLVRDASGFGEGVDQLVKEAGSVDLVFDERFSSDETDFTPIMVNLRDAGPNVALLWAIGSPSFIGTNAYRDLGIEAQLTLPTTSPVFLKEAGDNANGVVFPGEKMFVWDELQEDDPQFQVIQDFVDSYEQKYGEVPDHFAGAAHDAFMQAVEAFRDVGTDKEQVRQYLESLDGWVGVNGVYDRSADDHVGLGTEDLVIIEVVSGETPFDRWKLSSDQPG